MLCQYAFEGHDMEGKRLGVYISKMNGKKKSWAFKIRAFAWESEDKLPMPKWEENAVLGIEDDAPSSLKEVSLRQNQRRVGQVRRRGLAERSYLKACLLRTSPK